MCRWGIIIIWNTKEPTLTLKLILTSPLVRDELEKKDGEKVAMKDPPNLLYRQKCLNALVSFRHAKWFQARANGLKSCVIVLHILCDLCNRVPTWAPLKRWPLELICEKSIGTCNRPLGAGEALRRVMECLASGILLPGKGFKLRRQKNQKNLILVYFSKYVLNLPSAQESDVWELCCLEF